MTRHTGERKQPKTKRPRRWNAEAAETGTPTVRRETDDNSQL